MLVCNCGQEINNKSGFSAHKKYCSLTTDDVKKIENDYVLNFLSIKKIISKYKIGKSRLLKILKGKVRNYSESSKIARLKYPDKFRHTDQSKQKMRESRLKFMKENPDKTAWRQSNVSYPERIFIDKLNELKWNDKYLIIRERSIFPYFIDFAFENKKIAIEIDGSQHNKEDRKLSDSKKDKLLNSEGWLVLRFSANKILYEIDYCIRIIQSYLDNDDNEVGVYSHLEYKLERKKAERIKFGYSLKQREGQLIQRKVERPPYLQLLNEVKEFGYLDTGRKYNVSDNTIRKWIKMYEKYGTEF